MDKDFLLVVGREANELNDLAELAVRTPIYEAFGLRIASRIPLPELLPAGSGNSSGTLPAGQSADIEIELAKPNRLLEELEACGSNFSYSRQGDSRFLFLIPETAVYAIENGRTVAVAPLPDADPERVRVYLLGTCLGALLLIRRVLPLHGSAVVINGKAYAFLGDSGAGKSTLAAACASLGHPLVSDDVLAVTLDEKGRPFVQPSYPQQKLWRESLEGLGMDGRTYRSIYRETDKFAVPMGGRFHAGPVPLAGVFELAKPNPNAQDTQDEWQEGEGETAGELISIKPLSSLERLRALMRHTYRNRLIPRLGLEDWHFQTSVKLASEIEGGRLQRTSTGFTARRLAESIVQYANKGDGMR